LTGQSIPAPQDETVSSALFRAYLTDVVTALGKDLILIVEHLEAMPTDLVQALLTSLRAAYMDQQTLDAHVLVVISSALSLATLTVGESSPFRGIARRVLVGDLSEGESAALIADQLSAAGLSVSGRAREGLLLATSGDPFLIRRICEGCAEAAIQEAAPRLRLRTVRRVIHAFLQDEVYDYAPLQEAVRLIEEDPDLLRCILLMLSHGPVPRSSLPLPLSPDLDPLYLTGVVELAGDGSYRIQNQIYHDFFAQHFHAGHVGHVLTMTGQWDMAVDYLEAAIKEGDEQARGDLLSAVINSMYAADDIGQAARFLVRGLAAGFGVVDARVWYALPHSDCLRLMGHLGPTLDGELWSGAEMPLSADRLEARAWRQGRALRGPEGMRHVWRILPLLIPGAKPIGAITLCDDVLGNRAAGERERDRQLLGYLNQAARALETVTTRRRELALAGRMQASLLPATAPRVPGWRLSVLFRPAREASGDFYDFIPLPGDRLGIVVADVADKGMAAALYMALSRTLIRTYAGDHPDRPDLALRAANERVLADTQADLFVTVFYGILDPAAGTFTYCNAGHYPPYLLDPSGAAPVNALPGRGIALGILRETDWGHLTTEVPPGAALLLYTDGVLDAQNVEQERFGTEQMLDAVQSSLSYGDGPEDEVMARLQQFTGDAPQFDDITLVTLVRETDETDAFFDDPRRFAGA
ncbi:MAG: PP2C family protein-serine/threonine phosphatase, partial [Anaerolineae bacterium]